MLWNSRQTVEERGVDVTVHHAAIEEMDLATTFRSVLLAGPTFNHIVNDATEFGFVLRRADAPSD